MAYEEIQRAILRVVNWSDAPLTPREILVRISDELEDIGNGVIADLVDSGKLKVTPEYCIVVNKHAA